MTRSGARTGLVARLLVLMPLVIGGCAAPNHPTFDFDVERSGEQILVIGSTDLPDGSTVVVSVWKGCAGPGDPDYDPAVDSDWQDVQVSRGRFRADLLLEAGPSDEITTWVEFQPTLNQPEAVIEAYGATGEKLRGRGVVEESGVWNYVVATCE
jgi:hypothetical protein